MTLSAPSKLFFLISVVLAILALLGHFVMHAPLIMSSFYWLIASYVVLLAGCLFSKS